MRTPQTRVVPTGPENGYSADGRWLAQYYDDEMDTWFDIGDPHQHRVNAVFATLPTPDVVIFPEYYAAHEYMKGLLGDIDGSDEARFEKVIAALTQLIGSAVTIRAVFEKALSRSALARELLDLEREIHECVEAGLEPSDKRYEIGTEFHGKLRRRKLETEKLDGPEKDECLAIIDRTSRYMLINIFHLDPDDVGPTRV